MRVRTLRQRRSSYIRNAEEQPKKSLSFGKYFYLLVLFAAIASLFYWSYERIFFLSGIGFLEAETTFVEARNPGRIIRLNCAVNDTVAAGEALVILGRTESAHFIGSNGIYVSPQQQKLINIESKVKLLLQEVVHKKRQLSKLHGEARRARKLLALNAVTRPEVVKIEDRLEKAQYDLSILKIQFDTAQRLRQSYQRKTLLESRNGKTGWSVTAPVSERVLYAPTVGIVSVIYKQLGEIAQVGEPVLKIKNHNKTYIKAYFPASHESEISRGDNVIVQFEDGEEIEAYIRDIYPTAYAQPKEMGKRFGKAERYLVAEVVPKNERLRHRILETKVRVRISKKWFQ